MLVCKLALVGSLVDSLAGSLVGHKFVLGSSCHIECDVPTMGRCISGKLACGILVLVGGKLLELGIVVAASRQPARACNLERPGTQSARLHHCRLAHMGCS